MNEEMPKIVNQRLQKEYLKAIKNNGIIVASVIWITFSIVAVLDYILL